MIYSRSLIYSSKKCRTRTASLRNTSINWIFLERLLIQIISKPFITKKIQNKAKHLTRNAIKGTSIKKKSMSNSFESLRYIKCYSLSSPNLWQVLVILSDKTVEDLQSIQKTWNHTGNQTNNQISSCDQQTYYFQVFRRLY